MGPGPGWVTMAVTTDGLDFASNPYEPEEVYNTADLLDMLGFLGDLGGGLLYMVGHALGLGQAPVQVVTADYGAKFVVVAGLLNLISAVDAHNIAIGRKP